MLTFAGLMSMASSASSLRDIFLFFAYLLVEGLAERPELLNTGVDIGVGWLELLCWDVSSYTDNTSGSKATGSGSGGTTSPVSAKISSCARQINFDLQHHFFIQWQASLLLHSINQLSSNNTNSLSETVLFDIPRGELASSNGLSQYIVWTLMWMFLIPPTRWFVVTQHIAYPELSFEFIFKHILFDADFLSELSSVLL